MEHDKYLKPLTRKLNEISTDKKTHVLSNPTYPVTNLAISSRLG
jgi:hypothetical protein